MHIQESGKHQTCSNGWWLVINIMCNGKAVAACDCEVTNDNEKNV